MELPTPTGRGRREQHRRAAEIGPGHVRRVLVGHGRASSPAASRPPHCQWSASTPTTTCRTSLCAQRACPPPHRAPSSPRQQGSPRPSRRAWAGACCPPANWPIIRDLSPCPGWQGWIARCSGTAGRSPRRAWIGSRRQCVGHAQINVANQHRYRYGTSAARRGRNTTDLDAEPDRSRRGLRPISVKSRGPGCAKIGA